MQEQHPDTDDSGTDASGDSPAGVDTLHHEFKPSTKPAAVAIAITFVVSVLLAAYLALAQPLGPDNSPTAAAVVGLLGGVLVLRYVVRLVVLSYLTYVITDEGLRREFELLYSQRTRELPIHQVRAVELDASTFETLMGYGTLRFLSSGANHGLGYMSFDATPDPERRRDLVRDLVNETDDE